MTRLVSVTIFARERGMSRATVCNWIEKGLVQTQRTPAGRLRIVDTTDATYHIDPVIVEMREAMHLAVLRMAIRDQERDRAGQSRRELEILNEIPPLKEAV